MAHRASIVRFVLVALAAFPALVSAETLYFTNKRTLEIAGYQLRGHLIHITLPSGKKVLMRADTVDWEGTQRLKQPGMVLEYIPYEQADAGSDEGSGPAQTLTSSDLKKGGSFKLRRAGAPTIAVEVDSTQGWVDSRVNVKPGQTVTLRASGRVQLGLGMDSGPEGLGEAGSGTPVEAGQPYGSLLGRVGLGGSTFLVSGSMQLSPPGAGRLFFAVNDRTPGDNSGAYTVRIEMPAPAAASTAGLSSYLPGTTTAGRGPEASSAPAAPGRVPAKGFVGGVDRARNARDAATGR